MTIIRVRKESPSMSAGRIVVLIVGVAMMIVGVAMVVAAVVKRRRRMMASDGDISEQKLNRDLMQGIGKLHKNNPTLNPRISS